MTALQRTKSNGFTLDDCYELEYLRNVYETERDKLVTFLSPIDSIFDYPRAFFDEKQTELFRNGAILNADLVRFEYVYDGIYCLIDYNNRLSGLGKIEIDHSISIMQRFNYNDNN
jgi:tRNA U55 pseudouridine synthase TruB